MKKSISIFLEKFRRITSAGNYIPEIDGLKFVAIYRGLSEQPCMRKEWWKRILQEIISFGK